MSGHRRGQQRRDVPPGALRTLETDTPPLTTPEGGAEPVEHRERRPPLEPDPEDPPSLGGAPPPAGANEASALLARARAARRLAPPEGLHWRLLWERGRDQACAAIEGGKTIAEARALRVDRGCADCWGQGRDAALRVIEG